MTRPYQVSRPAPLTPAERMERKRKAKEQRAQAKAKDKPPVNYYLASKSKALKYNYAEIEEQHRAAVQVAALEIKKRQRRASADLLEIGQRFNEVKAMLPHGQFEDWIEIEIGCGLRLAQSFMAAAHRFDPKTAQNADLAARVFNMIHDKSDQRSLLEPSVIRLLGAKSVPDSAIEEVLAMAQTLEKPVEVAQVRAVIAEHKQTLPPKPPKPPKPKQLSGPVAEPDAIDAEYTIIHQDSDQITLTLTRSLVRKLQAGALRNQRFWDMFTGDELDRLNIIFSKALKDRNE